MIRADVCRCVGAAVLVVAGTVQAALRTASPVILTGAKLPSLIHVRPRELVAMSYNGKWREIPLQVDMRVDVPYSKIYDLPMLLARRLHAVVYADPMTFTGVDTDSRLDRNDEVVFMADDAGGRPGDWYDPPGVVSGSGVQVELADPLQRGRKAWVFLFRRKGGPRRATVSHSVKYRFKLKAGGYRENYRIRMGPNPEDSTVRSDYYTRHFSDRWISDGLAVLPPLGTGVDLLDMDKILLKPGMSLRSVETFARGEGAFVANKSGPVRAIRSFMGSNSGPFTQRRLFFYDRREDCHTFLRVHRLPGVLNFTDYSAEAKGMTYYNNLNTGGVKVDGVPDRLRGGELKWEMLTGRQGTVIVVHSRDTDIAGLKASSYYLDDANPRMPQITGDASAYAASGPWIRQPIPNTDPTAGGAKKLHSRRIRFYHAAGGTVALARRRAAEIATPLTVRISPAPAPARNVNSPHCHDSSESACRSRRS